MPMKTHSQRREHSLLRIRMISMAAKMTSSNSSGLPLNRTLTTLKTHSAVSEALAPKFNQRKSKERTTTLRKNSMKLLTRTKEILMKSKKRRSAC